MGFLLENVSRIYESWPEILGGFIAYNWHNVQHRIFSLAVKLLPKGWRK